MVNVVMIWLADVSRKNLSELLAQSLEELTRPFDPPRPGAPVPVRSAHEESATAQHAESAQETQQPHEPATAEPEVKVPEDSRLDADREAFEPLVNLGHKRLDSFRAISVA